MMIQRYYTLTITISNNFLKKSLKSIQHSDRMGRLNPNADRKQGNAEIDGPLSVKPHLLSDKLTKTTQLTYRQGPLEAPT